MKQVILNPLCSEMDSRLGQMMFCATIFSPLL